jgi:hypothetical protein
MPLDNSPANCQADPGAGIFLPGMQAAEYFEDKLLIFRLNTDAVVAHGNTPDAV